MKITSLQLKNFKRFTDLTIQGIPEDAKLVLLIGSNGSGKSSVFDAFEHLSTFVKPGVSYQTAFQYTDRNKYYSKKENDDYTIRISDSQARTHITTKSGTKASITSKSFYGRSSFRQIPVLTRKSLGGSSNLNLDSDRPVTFIDRDYRFENDIEKITAYILNEVFRSNKSSEEIREKYLDPINRSFENIFGTNDNTRLSLIEISPPLEGNISNIIFKKGKSEFHYNLLSAGEKEVFNVLINFVARGEYYDDTVFFFDEIDLHLNTKLQYNFLKELVENWIPENCQFWTASHSLGFIQYAKDSENAVIFDFDDYDFDQPKILTPEPKDNPNLYQIAVDKDILPNLFQHFTIVFVENKDKEYYASVGIKNTVFVPENGRNGVYHKVKSGEYQGIVDRDFLTDDDISTIEKTYKSLKILRYYSIENYLYHPDNLEEYYSKNGGIYAKAAYIQKLTAEKNAIKQSIILSLSLKRTEYPYFKEPDFNGKANQKRFKNEKENMEQATVLAKYLDSDSFEDYYKILPMKSYATHLPERQTISRSDLSKTNWFKQQIEEIIK